VKAKEVSWVYESKKGVRTICTRHEGYVWRRKHGGRVFPICAEE
jgi:hypothetical protein